MKIFPYKGYISKRRIWHESYLVWNVKYSSHADNYGMTVLQFRVSVVNLLKNMKTTAAPGLSSSEKIWHKVWKNHRISGLERQPKII